jgi:Kef-type K+ transport system membrane component KefB
MPTRATDTLALMTILAIGFAGALRVSWWVAAVGCCLLVLASLSGRWLGRPSYRTSVHSVSDPIQIAASAINGAATASAAYMVGLCAAWVWGL